MCFDGIWIKAISLIVMSVIALICGIYALKKMKWKPYEFMVVIVACIFLLVLGCKNVNYAINPEIKTISVNYNYQSSNGVIFGREYHFVDEKDNSYDLTMDPITTRKIFLNKDFNKKTKYIIKYEKKSNVIIYIEEVPNSKINKNSQ